MSKCKFQSSESFRDSVKESELEQTISELTQTISELNQMRSELKHRSNELKQIQNQDAVVISTFASEEIKDAG